MIKEVSGDILLSNAELTAHGVAPNDHMDQGLALELRKQWPAMFKDFRHLHKSSHPKSGSLWFWGGPGGTRIANLFTQEEAESKGGLPGQATVSNVRHCMKELRKLIEEEQVKSVALPRLATGVGRLDWDDVRPLIDEYLGDLDVDVIVYSEFHAGVQADEGLQ